MVFFVVASSGNVMIGASLVVAKKRTANRRRLLNPAKGLQNSTGRRYAEFRIMCSTWPTES
jgi:hypothetical protein